jgi:hypothetical protein
LTTTTLAQALSASGQSITLTDAGDLVFGDLLALDAEFCRILKVLTPTQALVQRGVNGTPSAAHLVGAVVNVGVPEDFLTGPQQLPAFGIDTNVLTGLGPSEAATFQPSSGGGGGAPANATYVVLSLNATLTNERVLTAGANITLTDGGAGSTLTIAAASSGTGTVTSVGLSLPAMFTVSGSPVTTTGTLTAVLATQVTKTFLAGPTSGADAVPTFRVLAAADIPDLSAVYSPVAGNSSLVTVGTITAGTWHGDVITGQYGGTGVANTGKTITIGGNVTTSGAFALTMTLTGTTGVTLPTTGTLATLAGAEALSNKTGLISQWTNDSGYITAASVGNTFVKTFLTMGG